MLSISRKILEKIASFCESGYPFETCGLILGSVEKDKNEVIDIFFARNINADRKNDRYELNPEDFLNADKKARETETEIIGIFHSHPDKPAVASETDRELAWIGYSYLILSVKVNKLDHFKSWRLDGVMMREEVVEVNDA